MQGDFSASQLLAIKLKAEEMWSDAQSGADFQPYADAAVIVSQNQTARFQQLENPNKDNKVIVNWVKACEVEVEDCETNCTLDEPEVETAGKEYEYDICKKVGFSIDAEKLRSNTYNFDEVVAPSLAMAIKKLDEFWAQKILVKMKAFAGVNLAPQPFNFDVPKNATIVPASLYGTVGSYTGFQLPTILTKQMIQNKINSPYFIDNGRLWLEYQNSLLKSGATDGASIAGLNRARGLNVNFDLFNFGAAGITDVTTFAVGRNAIAFKTHNRHTATPELVGGQVQQTRYTVPSIAIPNVFYDVYYTISCKTVGGKAHIMHTWRLETNGGIWLNPEGCPVTVGATPSLPAGTYTPTGILAYVSDDEVTP